VSVRAVMKLRDFTMRETDKSKGTYFDPPTGRRDSCPIPSNVTTALGAYHMLKGKHEHTPWSRANWNNWQFLSFYGTRNSIISFTNTIHRTQWASLIPSTRPHPVSIYTHVSQVVSSFQLPKLTPSYNSHLVSAWYMTRLPQHPWIDNLSTILYFSTLCKSLLKRLCT
jgi:hypothetical protein